MQNSVGVRVYKTLNDICLCFVFFQSFLLSQASINVKKTVITRNIATRGSYPPFLYP